MELNLQPSNHICQLLCLLGYKAYIIIKKIVKIDQIFKGKVMIFLMFLGKLYIQIEIFVVGFNYLHYKSGLL
jgi:hypothetical protein